jgi:hypothetical protein
VSGPEHHKLIRTGPTALDTNLSQVGFQRPLDGRRRERRLVAVCQLPGDGVWADIMTLSQ